MACWTAALTLTVATMAPAIPAHGADPTHRHSAGSDRVVVVRDSDNAVVSIGVSDSSVRPIADGSYTPLDLDPVHHQLVLFNSDTGVWLVSTDGTGLRHVLDTPGWRMANARWRPGYDQAAVIVELEDGTHIFVIDAASGAVSEVAAGLVPQGTDIVGWSPDAGQVVVQRTFFDREVVSDFARIPLAGGGPVPLGRDLVYAPSPGAGAALVLRPRGANAYDVLLMSKDLGSSTLLRSITSRTLVMAGWSADGSRSYAHYTPPRAIVDGRIDVMDTAGRIVSVVGDAFYEGDLTSEPASVDLSPDGSLIVTTPFIQARPFVEDLTNGRACPIPIQDGSDLLGAHWGPDGSYLLMGLYNVQSVWQVRRGAAPTPPGALRSGLLVGVDAPPRPVVTAHPCPRVPSDRSVGLQHPDRHHLRATVLAGLERGNPCTRHIPVRLERRTGGRWRAVATQKTNGRGKATFDVSVAGRYRARVTKVARDPLICQPATSNFLVVG